MAATGSTTSSGSPAGQPRRTPLYAVHRALGARLIDFAGWEMPVQYAGGILAEHRAVRTGAGIFDLSHMGELYVEGTEAGSALAHALVSDPTRLTTGRAQYSLICQPDGGIIDDLIVYRVADDRFLVVPNASNAAVVADELRARLAAAGLDARLDDASDRTALVAIQGPAALGILAPLTDADVAGLRSYACLPGAVAGVSALVARTGYTGEDGFELFVDAPRAQDVWEALSAAGSGQGLVPVGLGARDTLRLEAGMPLYGNELDVRTTPFEAGLGRVVRFDRPHPFVGRDALEAAATTGPRRQLVGFEVEERAIPRHGYAVHVADEEVPVGEVTSGTLSPTLGRPIAIAYVPPYLSAPGTMLEVAVRGSRVPARVVPLPFYRRAS
jgi:aminomethyltransferase